MAAIARGFVCLCGVALLAFPLWPAILAGYPGDSFWTLGIGGRSGVVAISFGGFAALFAGCAVLLRRVPVGPGWTCGAIAAGLLAYAIIYSVSPQVFYSFYRLIFPGLPTQWVIDGMLDFARLSAAIDLRTAASLSDDLAGVGFWALIPFVLWHRVSA